MKKNNLYIALGTLAALPLLMMLQQFLMPRQTPRPPRPLRSFDGKMLIATEEGLTGGHDRAKHIAYAAAVHASRGKHKTAENWLRLGAAEFRYPSMMQFYGDYLFSQKRYIEARRWYLLAEKYALADKQAFFADFVRKKITTVDGILQQSKGKMR
jgi:hypothetical protein